MLVLSRKIGETVHIGPKDDPSQIVVELRQFRFNPDGYVSMALLAFTASKEISIFRGELLGPAGKIPHGICEHGNRFFLEIMENGERLIVGDPKGYPTLNEARKQALKRVDDALPNNRVRILRLMDEAYFGGDGEAHLASG